MKIVLDEDDKQDVLNAIERGAFDALQSLTEESLSHEIRKVIADSLVPAVIAASRRINNEVVLVSLREAFVKALREVAQGEYGG